MPGRIRTIKPEILTDEKSAGLSHEAWRLWVSMFVMADDVGNLPAAARLLTAQAFWAQPADTARALRELERAGLVSLYRVHGQDFATIVGFRRHQKINRPSGAKYPSPDTADPHGGLSEGSVRAHRLLSEGSLGDHDHDHDRDHDLLAASPLATAGPPQVSKRKAKRAKAPPHPDHQRWIDRVTALYEQRYSVKPTWEPKQIGIATRLLKAHGYERCCERAERLFQSPPQWLRGGCDIGTLAANFDKLVATNGHHAPVVSTGDDEDEVLNPEAGR